MIKSIYEKWEEIEQKAASTSKSCIAAYYVGKTCPCPVYFAVIEGKKGVYIEFDAADLNGYKCPSVNGLVIEVKREPKISSAKSYLYVENNAGPQEIYMAFTNSLMDALAETTIPLGVIEAFENTIKDLRAYFSNSKKPLSEKEEQGICAELLFLKEEVEKHGENAVLRWMGPEKNKRDFVFEDYSVEIKSTGGQIQSNVLITNENQLDPTYPKDMKKLYLAVYVLEKNDNGFNVVSLAKGILDLLTSISIQHAFVAKLLMNRVDLEDYEPKASFTFQIKKQYLVSDDFPSIRKNNIPSAAFDVAYRLDLSQLASFENGDVL